MDNFEEIKNSFMEDVKGFDNYDSDKIIKNFTKALEFDSKFADAYTNRGLAYCTKGDYDKAIEDFTKSMEFNPNDEMAYFARCLAFCWKKDYKAALSNLEKISSNADYYYEAQLYLGMILSNKKVYDRAIVFFERIPQDNLNYGVAQKNIGRIEGLRDKEFKMGK